MKRALVALALLTGGFAAGWWVKPGPDDVAHVLSSAVVVRIGESEDIACSVTLPTCRAPYRGEIDGCYAPQAPERSEAR